MGRATGVVIARSRRISKVASRARRVTLGVSHPITADTVETIGHSLRTTAGLVQCVRGIGRLVVVVDQRLPTAVCRCGGRVVGALVR